jgi:hypothetical protein
MARTKPTIRKSKPYCPERHKRYLAVKKANMKRQRDEQLQEISEIKAFEAIPATLVTKAEFDELKTRRKSLQYEIANNFNILESGDYFVQVSHTRNGGIKWCNIELIVKQLVKKEFDKARKHDLIVSSRNRSDTKVIMELIPNMIGKIYTKESFYQAICPTLTQLIQSKIDIDQTCVVLSTKQQFLSRFNL